MIHRVERNLCYWNSKKIPEHDLEELLGKDSDNDKECFILSDSSLWTQPNVHDSSKENNTEKQEDVEKKVLQTQL